jgi:ATP-binding cassette, subfamily G (WHITE), member 2, SNQ2
MKAWFRALAAAMKSEATAQAVAGISVLLLVLYTGYGKYQMVKVYFVLTFVSKAIPQPSMIGALRWITYVNVRRHPFWCFICIVLTTSMYSLFVTVSKVS